MDDPTINKLLLHPCAVCGYRPTAECVIENTGDLGSEETTEFSIPCGGCGLMSPSGFPGDRVSAIARWNEMHLLIKTGKEVSLIARNIGIARANYRNEKL